MSTNNNIQVDEYVSTLFKSVLRNQYIRSIIFQSIHSIHVTKFGKDFLVYTYVTGFDGYRRKVLNFDQCWSVKWLVENRYIHLILDRLKLNRRLRFGNGELILKTVELIESVKQFEYLHLRVGSLIESNAYILLNALALCPYDVLFALGDRYNGTTKAIDQAATFNHIDNIRYLADRGLRGTAKALSGASQNGHFDVVRLLIEQKLVADDDLFKNTDPLDRAADGGHIAIVSYLHSLGMLCTKLAMDKAATNGHLEVVKFLHKNRTEGCSEMAIDGAAKFGHLDVVKFLHYNRSAPCTSSAMLFSCKNNADGSMVSFLLDHPRLSANSGTNSTYFMRFALQNHNDPSYPAVKILLERHPPSRKNLHLVLSDAFNTNNLEVADAIFKVMVEELPNWETYTFDLRINKHVGRPMLDWINKHCSITTNPFHTMINVDLRIIKYLIEERGYISNASMVSRCVEYDGDMEMLCYLMERCREPIPGQVIFTAAKKNRIDVVKYILENYKLESNYQSRHCLEMAAMNGNLELFVYLAERDKSVCLKTSHSIAKTFHHYQIQNYINTNRQSRATNKEIK